MSSTVEINTLEKKLQQIISNIRNLPTPPIVFEQIQKVINCPDTSIGEIAKILAEDPAMSVKILRLTNSAFYGLSREIDSVKQAVMIVGLEAVKNLVLSASVLSMFKANAVTRQYHEDFWRHSLSTALVARLIAREYKSSKIFGADPSFSSGLIHDIGKMVICSFLPNEHKQVSEYIADHPQVTDLEAETTVMGFNHAQLGRQLAITWKLPDRLADTVGYHHTPDMENASDDYAYLINLADYIAHAGSMDNGDAPIKHKLNPNTLEFFRLEESQIEDIKTRLIEEYLKAETFISIAGHR